MTTRNTDTNRTAISGAGRNQYRAAPVVPKHPARPSPRIGPNPASAGRAEAAYRHEFDRWQLQIDAVQADKSLSPDQRATAIAGLRFRQQVEANAARKRVLEDEKQRTKSARRAARNILKAPVTPT